jgi:hypothetical protein
MNKPVTLSRVYGAIALSHGTLMLSLADALFKK